MDERAWQEWQSRPETREFFDAIKAKYELEKENLACGAYDATDAIGLAVKYAQIRGGLDVLRDFKDMTSLELFEEMTNDGSDISVD